MPHTAERVNWINPIVAVAPGTVNQQLVAFHNFAIALHGDIRHFARTAVFFGSFWNSSYDKSICLSIEDGCKISVSLFLCAELQINSHVL